MARQEERLFLGVISAVLAAVELASRGDHSTGWRMLRYGIQTVRGGVQSLADYRCRGRALLNLRRQTLGDRGDATSQVQF